MLSPDDDMSRKHTHPMSSSRYWAARNTCPKCNYSWTNDLSSSVMNLRKVDFFWINRDQFSFEWFVRLLSQLEVEQAEMGGGWKNTFFSSSPHD